MGVYTMNDDLSTITNLLDTDPAFSTSQAAHYLGVCPHTVLKLIDMEKLSAFAVGQNYRIRLSAIKNYETRFAVTKRGRREPRNTAYKKREGELQTVSMPESPSSIANNQSFS